MAVYATFVLVLAAMLFAAWRFLAADRRAGRAAKAARMEALRREAGEREVMRRLKSVKEKDVRTAAARAIKEDPERAARVVKRMLRDRENS